jgi:hypothetical protein
MEAAELVNHQPAPARYWLRRHYIGVRYQGRWCL